MRVLPADRALRIELDLDSRDVKLESSTQSLAGARVHFTVAQCSMTNRSQGICILLSRLVGSRDMAKKRTSV